MSETGSSRAGGGAAAQMNASHELTKFLAGLVQAPASARISMAIGELATSMDNAAGDGPFAVTVSATQAEHRLGLTAMALAALWSRWGRSTCLIDLGTGAKSLAGAIVSTNPDLASACNGSVSGLSTLHSQLPNSGVIALGNADVLALLSTGKLAALVNNLKKNYDRVVLAAPALVTGFPFISMNSVSDRLVLSVLAGQTRGAALREVAEQTLLQGLRPIEVIFHE